MGGCDTLCVWSQLGSNESLLVHWCQHFGRKYWQLRQYIFRKVGTVLPDCAVSEHRTLNTLFSTPIRPHMNAANFMLFLLALRSPPPKHAVPSYSSTNRLPNTQCHLTVLPTASQTRSAISQFYQPPLPIAFPCQNFNNISCISHEYSTYRFADSLRAGSGRFRPDPARKLYDIYHCCVYSEKLLMKDRGTVRNM